MTSTEILVHSVVQGGDLLHDVQTTSAFRFKVMTRELASRGYERVQSDRHEGKWHAAMFYSLQDKEYHAVPPREHSSLLKAIGLPSNKVDVRLPTQYTTHVTKVRNVRSRKVRPRSPVRMG